MCKLTQTCSESTPISQFLQVTDWIILNILLQIWRNQSVSSINSEENKHYQNIWIWSEFRKGDFMDNKGLRNEKLILKMKCDC